MKLNQVFQFAAFKLTTEGKRKSEPRESPPVGHARRYLVRVPRSDGADFQDTQPLIHDAGSAPA